MKEIDEQPVSDNPNSVTIVGKSTQCCPCSRHELARLKQLALCDCKPVKLAGSGKFDAEFVIGTSRDFAGRSFDLCLIDGDHSLAAVSADFDQVGRRSKMCAFHDINDAIVESYPGHDGGVPCFWRRLKAQGQNLEFHEFVSHTRGSRVMGLGLAVQRGERIDSAAGPDLGGGHD